MTRIQQSIEIGVPVRTAYNQLTQFEDYPHFMQDVESVHQLDDAHLHWSAKMPQQTAQTMEWDIEITEQLPDKCIAWRNVNGPANTGKVELQPTVQGTVRVTMTMECDSHQMLLAQDEDPEIALTQRLAQDLTRFKAFIETRGSETGEWRGEVRDGRTIMQNRDAQPPTGGEPIGKAIGQTADEQREERQAGAQGQQSASGSTPAPTSSYAAGSEGWDGSEDPTDPVTSAAQSATSTVRSASDTQPAPPSVAHPVGQQADKTMQSASSLSQSSDDQAEEGQFAAAEEINFDQQSDEARRVGQMPQDVDAPVNDTNPSDAMKQSMTQDEAETERLKRAIKRTVPPLG